MTFTYFAYGSNMLMEWLRARCESAQSIAVAALPDYALRFSKRSQDGSAKCTIVPTQGEQVWGVVYEISTAEERLLDRAEGFPNGYSKLDVEVASMGRGDIRARTYIGNNLDDALRPHDWYHALVIAGATQHDLPPEWITSIKGTPSTPDTDAGRRERALQALLEAGYEGLLTEPTPA